MRDRLLGSTTRPFPFFMVLSSDHQSPATGLSPTVTISKDCGSFASPAGAVSEIGNGWYALAGNATDRNTLGSFLLHAEGSGADKSDTSGTVVAYDPFNATNLGLANLDVTVGSRSNYSGGAVASVTGAVGSVTAPVSLPSTAPSGYGPGQSVTLDGGSVLFSPVPTAGGFSSSSAGLHAPSGGYVGMRLLFQTGPNTGTWRVITGHTLTSGVHAFAFAAAASVPLSGPFAAVPTLGGTPDTFDIG